MTADLTGFWSSVKNNRKKSCGQSSFVPLTQCEREAVGRNKNAPEGIKSSGTFMSGSRCGQGPPFNYELPTTNYRLFRISVDVAGAALTVHDLLAGIQSVVAGEHIAQAHGDREIEQSVAAEQLDGKHQ